MKVRERYFSLFEREKEFKQLLLCKDNKLVNDILKFVCDPVFDMQEIVNAGKSFKMYFKGNTHYCELYIRVTQQGVMYIKIIKIGKRNRYAETNFEQQRINYALNKIESERN